MVLAKGFHPFPFRTRQLSPSAPMVLHGKLCGRVGRRRGINFRGPKSDLRAFSFSKGRHRRRRRTLPGEPEGGHPLGIIQCRRPRFIGARERVAAVGRPPHSRHPERSEGSRSTPPYRCPGRSIRLSRRGAGPGGRRRGRRRPHRGDTRIVATAVGRAAEELI